MSEDAAKLRPYTAAELYRLVEDGRLVDLMRILATYGRERNWKTIYSDKVYWGWVGPTISPVDLAAIAITNVTSRDLQRRTGMPNLVGIPMLDLEKEAIIQAIDACDGNYSQAHRMLGFAKKTFYRKLHKHGIPLAHSWPRQEDSAK